MNKELLKQDQDDVAFMMSKIHQNGGEFWATKDNRIAKGSPFSTRDAAIILHELGYKKNDPVIKAVVDTLLNTWQEDGRFRIAPGEAIYPCHTIGSARVLCYLGRAKDKRLKQTFEHLMEIQHDDGGWQCNKFVFGRGPETNHSNPGPTLEALDAFRHTSLLNSDPRLDKAVEFLLWHWKHKKPVGPCQFGIGSLFSKVEFPFFRYNLFLLLLCTVLLQESKKSKRFKEALQELSEKLEDGKIIVENPNRQLSNMNLCRKGTPSNIATIRYKELLRNFQ